MRPATALLALALASPWLGPAPSAARPVARGPVASCAVLEAPIPGRAFFDGGALSVGLAAPEPGTRVGAATNPE